MRTWTSLVIVLTLHSATAADRFVITESHAPTPRREVPAALLLDAAALAAVCHPAPRDVLVVMAPFACPPCEWTRAQCGTGDEEVAVRYVSPADVDFVPRSYPAIYLPDVRKVHYGALDLAGVKRMIETHPAPATVSAITIGSFRAPEGFRDLLQHLRSTSTGIELDLGTAALTLPKRLTIEWSPSPDGGRLQFSGARPTLRLGSGAFSITRPLTAITLTSQQLTLSLENCPDLTLRLEP